MESENSLILIYKHSLTWVKQSGALLPDAYDPEVLPEVGELDELETFVGSKKTKAGCGLPLTTSEQGF